MRKQLDQEEFDAIKTILDTRMYSHLMNLNEIAEWTHRSLFTVRKIDKAATFSHYKKLTQAHNKKYATNKTHTYTMAVLDGLKAKNIKLLHLLDRAEYQN